MTPATTLTTNMRRIEAAQGPVFAAGTDYPAGVAIPAHRHDRHQLLQHEALVHSLTALNGREQPLMASFQGRVEGVLIRGMTVADLREK